MRRFPSRSSRSFAAIAAAGSSIRSLPKIVTERRDHRRALAKHAAERDPAVRIGAGRIAASSSTRSCSPTTTSSSPPSSTRRNQSRTCSRAGTTRWRPRGNMFIGQRRAPAGSEDRARFRPNLIRSRTQRPGKNPNWHKTILTSVELKVDVRGGHTLKSRARAVLPHPRRLRVIPAELIARGFRPDSLRWWIDRWGTRPSPTGNGVVGAASGRRGPGRYRKVDAGAQSSTSRPRPQRSRPAAGSSSGACGGGPEARAAGPPRTGARRALPRSRPCACVPAAPHIRVPHRGRLLTPLRPPGQGIPRTIARQRRVEAPMAVAVNSQLNPSRTPSDSSRKPRRG